MFGCSLIFCNCEAGLEVTHARKNHKFFGFLLAYS